jgi:hypothetical protein
MIEDSYLRHPVMFKVSLFLFTIVYVKDVRFHLSQFISLAGSSSTF